MPLSWLSIFQEHLHSTATPAGLSHISWARLYHVTPPAARGVGRTSSASREKMAAGLADQLVSRICQYFHHD